MELHHPASLAAFAQLKVHTAKQEVIFLQSLIICQGSSRHSFLFHQRKSPTGEKKAFSQLGFFSMMVADEPSRFWEMATDKGADSIPVKNST